MARDGDAVAVRYRPRYATRRPARVEAVLASLLNLTRWSTGEAFRARALTLSHPAQAAPGRYQEKLGVPVTFEANHNALVFGADQLTLPLMHANPALCRHLRGLADELLARLDHRSLGARVSELIRENPGWERSGSPTGWA